MNIRDISAIDCSYYEINREERNYAAILYAALCRSDNAIRFLELCGLKNQQLGSEFGIYFEYSLIRDIWDQIDSNEVKKKIIGTFLDFKAIHDLLGGSILSINEKFGVSGKPSSNFIESPGNWAISKYSQNFFDNEEFLRICKFKWSFNIKPDLVIQINKSNAVCIEAKYKSSEGKYPSSAKDTKIFETRGIKKVGQTALQKYMMEQVLGIRTEFRYLVQKKSKSDTHQVLFWKDAFESLKLDGMPNFAIQMINKISNKNV